MPLQTRMTKNYILIIIPNQPLPKKYSKFHITLENKQSLRAHHNELLHNLDHPEIDNKNNKSGLKTPGTKKDLKLYLIMWTRFKSGGGDNNNDRIRA